MSALSSTAATPALAMASADAKSLEISSVEVTDVTDMYHAENQSESRFQLEKIMNESTKAQSVIGLDIINNELDQLDVVVDKVMNLGAKVWSVIEKGRPSMSYKFAKANALPLNILNWQQLENWQSPKSKYYQIVYKNAYGIEVVKLVYKIVYLFGGGYYGQGKYLGYVSVEPHEMKTAYLFNFNVEAKVESVFNKGTKENPVAGMILNVQWTVETFLKKETRSNSYSVDGLGNFIVL